MIFKLIANVLRWSQRRCPHKQTNKRELIFFSASRKEAWKFCVCVCVQSKLRSRMSIVEEKENQFKKTYIYLQAASPLVPEICSC